MVTAAGVRDPHDLGNADIVLSHFTLSRHHDIHDRVAAAAAGGVDGIGLYLRDYEAHEASGFAPHGLAELLDEHNLCLAEIEVLRGWADPDVVDTDGYRSMEATAWRMADAFGCRYVQAIGDYVGTIADAGAAFGALCDRAADHDLVVGLEFLPFTNIYGPREAMAIAEAADRDNGGLCVDIWHHTRGHNDISLIEQIPGERIMGIQMSDGPIEPTIDDYVDDCLRFRVPPGDGQFDVSGFVDTLITNGASVPWSLEVCNEDAAQTDGADHVRVCAARMRSYLPS